MTEAERPSTVRLVLAWATVYLVWGSTYLGIRFAIESIPPFLMAGSRHLLAGLLLFAWSRLRQRASTSESCVGDPLVELLPRRSRSVQRSNKLCVEQHLQHVTQLLARRAWGSA